MPRKSWIPEAPRAGHAATRVFFGATVRYTNAAGAERVVSIVGVDEVDLDRNYISWVSPLARALMKSGCGRPRRPSRAGRHEQLEILDVRYERIPVEPFREPPGAQSAPRATSPTCAIARGGCTMIAFADADHASPARAALLVAVAPPLGAQQILRWGGDAEGGAPFVEADPARSARSSSASTSRSPSSSRASSAARRSSSRSRSPRSISPPSAATSTSA